MKPTIETLLQMPTPDLETYLRQRSDLVSDNKGMYFFKSNPLSTVCAVAHIDTLAKYPILLRQHEGYLHNEYGILGADDRAGVFAVLEALETLNCNILFTNLEERGGIGVKAFLKEASEVFNHVTFFIEADRQGFWEFVTYNDLSKKVDDLLYERWGLYRSVGSFSDILFLSDYYRVPSINLAMGFVGEHGSGEKLFLQKHRIMTNLFLEILEDFEGLERIEISKSKIFGAAELYPEDDHQPWWL